MAQMIEVNGKEYEYFYTSEDGDYFTPKVVIHGAEPWMKLTKDEKTVYALFNGLWSKVDEWKVVK